MHNAARQKEKAIEAARVLNNMLLDLVTGTQALNIYDLPTVSEKGDRKVRTGLDRMAISHLVVSLHKWIEFYDWYKAYIPAEEKNICRSLCARVKAKGISDFRHKVVGHLIDDATERPLTSEEIDARLRKILGEDPRSFFRWINDPREKAYPSTVVSITEHVRDRIREQYDLSDQEIV